MLSNRCVFLRDEQKEKNQTRRNSKKHSPLSMLSAQGFSKLCWILGHEAWVFHVLANADAVPSIIPLITLKSSVWMLLKFPQRPVEKQWKVYIALTTKSDIDQGVLILHSLTTSLVFERSIQADKHLHHGCELHFNLDTKACVHDHEEWWRSEHGDISYTWETKWSLSEQGQMLKTQYCSFSISMTVFANSEVK